MMLEAGARATVYDTRFSHNSAVAGSVAALESSREYVDRIGAVVWFHDCRFNLNRKANASIVTCEDLRGFAYTNTGDFGIRVREVRCSDQLSADENRNEREHHCNRKTDGLAALSEDPYERGEEDIFAHVTAATQALPRPSDTAFRQVVGEQVACTGMPPLDLPDLPSGFDMIVVDRPWFDSLHALTILVFMGGFVAFAVLYPICSLLACLCRSAYAQAARTICSSLKSTLRSMKRCVEAVFQWVKNLVTEVKEARRIEVECGRMTCSAAESASCRKGDASEVVATCVNAVPEAGTHR